MPAQRNVFRVFVASPGDLVHERIVTRTVVDEINRAFSHHSSWQIQWLGWEDTLPGVGRPQSLINPDVDAADLFLGCLWKRIGSPASENGPTGFEEEFLRAMARRTHTTEPEICVYFKKVAADEIAAPDAQLARVLAFRKECERRGEILFKQFDGPDWAQHVRELLTAQLLKHSNKIATQSAFTANSPAEDESSGNLHLALAPKFFGRASDIEAVMARLEGHRLVSIIGPGGIGKTRLARELDRSCSERVWARGGRWFVSLDGLRGDDEDAILELIGTALGRVAPPNEIKNSVIQRLKESHSLLVIDNCETAPRAAAKVILGLLQACPHLHILSTSQRPLGLKNVESIVELNPLDVPKLGAENSPEFELLPGYQLLLDRIRLEREDWMPDTAARADLAEILRATEGLPLAIELVAPWIAQIPLSEIAAGLSRTPLGPFTGSMPGEYAPITLPDRHHSLQRCLEWSFQRLTSDEQVAYLRVGVFAGPFTEEAAEAVCDLNPEKRLLISLVRCSAIQRVSNTDPVRFVMARFKRSFAREKGAALQRELVSKHLAYFGRKILAAFESRSKDARLAELDRLDLMAAADAAHASQPRLVWLLSRELGPTLKAQGLWVERERLARAAVEAAEKNHEHTAVLRALLDLGDVLQLKGDWAGAAERYERSYALAAKGKPPNFAHQSGALERLFHLWTRMGRTSSATETLSKLHAIAPQLNSSSGRARMLDAVGRGFEDLALWAKALENYSLALDVRQAAKDDNGIARSRLNIGRVLIREGRVSQAESELKLARDQFAKAGLKREEAITLHFLGELKRRDGQLLEARQYLEASLPLRGNEPKGRAITLQSLGRLYRTVGHLDRAEAVFTEGANLCQGVGDIQGFTMLRGDLATLRMIQGRLQDAINILENCCEVLRDRMKFDLVGLAVALDRLGEAHCRSEDWHKATLAFEESLELSCKSNRREQAVFTLLKMAHLYSRQKKTEQALSCVRRGLALSKGRRNSRTLVAAAEGLHALEKRLASSINASPQAAVDAQFIAQTISIRRMFEEERSHGDWLSLTQNYEEFVRIQIGLGAKIETAIGYNELGSAYRRCKRHAEAESVLLQAGRMFQELSIPAGEAASLHKLGKLFAETGRLKEAEKAFLRSIELKVSSGAKVAEAISQCDLAQVYLNMKRLEEADRAAHRALEIVAEAGTPRQQVFPLIILVRLALQRSNRPKALQLAKDGLKKLEGENSKVAADARRALIQILGPF